MIYSINNFEISIGRKTDKEYIRHKKMKDYKKTATESLIAAEMTLELQKAMQSKQEDHNLNEAERKGLQDSIDTEQKSVYNWITQLEVINSWK